MTELYPCGDCAHWKPCLNLFGGPTGHGGCRFSKARNLKEDLLRECNKYEGKKVEIEVKPRETRELESLIIFWKDSLAQHRLLMEPSAIYLVEQTIKALQALLKWIQQ